MTAPVIGSNKQAVADYCKANNKKVVSIKNSKGLLEYIYVDKNANPPYKH